MKLRFVAIAVVIGCLILGCEPPKPKNAASNSGPKIEGANGGAANNNAANTANANNFAAGVKAAGKVTTVNIPAKPFTKIKATGPCQLTVNVGGPESISVTADENLHKVIQVDSDPGELWIHPSAGSYTLSSKKEAADGASAIKIDVTVPSLEKISSMGLGHIVINNLRGPKFTIDTVGNGNFTLTGEVDHLTLELSGQGDVDASGLVAKKVTLNFSPADIPSVKVKATELLEGKVGPFVKGSITYFGNPASVQLAPTATVTVTAGK